MNLDLDKKISAILLLIGVALLLITPVIGSALDKTTIIYPKTEEEIDEDSMTEIKEAYTKEFKLIKNQRLIIKISVKYKNSSVHLIIVGKGDFEATDDKDAPTTLAAKEFVYSEYAIGEDPVDSVSHDNEAALENDAFFYIEFMGDRIGTSLISVPGDYLIVVYGENLGVKDDEVTFDIEAMLDGPYDAGDILKIILPIAGIILIALILVPKLNELIKSVREI